MNLNQLQKNNLFSWMEFHRVDKWPLRASHMLNSRWPMQEELEESFVDLFLSYIAVFVIF